MQNTEADATQAVIKNLYCADHTLLPGMKKVIERSFISGHMLVRADIMKWLIQEIE